MCKLFSLKFLLMVSLVANLYAVEMKTPETSKHFVRRVDPQSGVVSYVLKTRVAYDQQSFYFINRSMTNDGRFLLFSCTNPNKVQTMGVVDFKKDQVYNLPEISNFGPSPYLDVETADLYWGTTEGIFHRSLCSHCNFINKVCGVPESFPTPEHRFYQLATHLVPNASKTEFFLDSRVDNKFICGDVDIATGNYTQWGQMDWYFHHAQFSPIDDNLVLIDKDAWSDVVTGEFNWIPTNADGIFERLWLWKKGEAAPKLIAPINGGKATHEWWAADGKSFYYVTYPQWGIVRYDIKTGQSSLVKECNGSKAHSSSDDRYFVFEHAIGQYYSGCPHQISFYNSVTDKTISIVSNSPARNDQGQSIGTLYPSEPNTNFVCNDKYVVGTINIDRKMNVLVTPVAQLIEKTK